MKKIIFTVPLLALILLCNTGFAQYYRWVTISSGTPNNLKYFYQPFMCGDNGTLLRTTNNGQNWISQPSGTSASLNHVLISQNNFASGNNETILRSTNSGVNWSIVNSGGTGNIYAISLTAPNTYTAVGALSGNFLKSTNAGVNWFTASSGTSETLNSILLQGVNIWIAGNNGTLLRSTNFGSSYSPIVTGSNANFRSIKFFNSQIGIIIGSNGTILRTTDAGTSWIPQNSGTTNTLNSINITDANKMWICGNNGTLLNTTNGGSTWSSELILPPVNLNTIYFHTEETGVIGGDGGLILQRQVDSSSLPTIRFAPNDLSTWLKNSGIFNQDTRTLNTPGLQWPAGTGKFTMLTSGFTISAYVNNNIRSATASYTGEYRFGYCVNGEYRTDSTFRFYIVKPGQNANTNPDWLNWGRMAALGAPYVDHNNNHQYDPYIDTPGVRGASETIFMSMTDADPTSHNPGEGFSGGTTPLGTEVHVTAWGYNRPGFEDVQFLKWEVYNKSNTSWNSTYFSIISDPDIGTASDDYVGCDTSLELSYCYNSDNQDGTGTGNSYGTSPPAVGFDLLRGAHINPNQDLGMTSFSYFSCTACSQTTCERTPESPLEAYNFMKGFKKDRTPWVNPITLQPTKHTYPGDPETNAGWIEAKGRILNCGGSLTGPVEAQTPPGDRRMLLSTGDTNLTIPPGGKQTIVAAQFVARGSTNLNSVTRLKSLSNSVQTFYNNNISISVQPISDIIPHSFSLYQNYPNPFNPVTKIRFDIPSTTSGITSLSIYDITGKELVVLVNEKLNAGSYEVQWDGNSFASGVYFSKLETGNYKQTRKMILMK